jgi:hypothetical protein
MKTRIALILSALVAANANAEIPLDFNASGQAVFTRIKTADESFSPKLFQFKAGVELTDTSLSGIGLQLMAATPISDSSKNGLTLDVKEQHGAYLTFTDPDATSDALKFVLFVGYASTKLEMEPVLLGGNPSSKFSGTSFGFSLQQRIVADMPISWTIDCTRFYRDSDLRMDGCGLGATYDF